MKITVPEYFNDFACIGGKCEDTCCAGWEVVVDEESAARFLEVPGELGKRLQAKLKLENGEYTFPLENGRCPFLNDKNLCDIQAALGEPALCRTCRMFPRFEEEYGDLREMGLSFSCPETAKIMLRQTEMPRFLQEKTVEPVSRPNDFDPYYFDCIFEARELMFRLIFRKDFPLPIRAALILTFSKELQKTVKRQNTKKTEKIFSQFSDDAFLQKTAEKLKGKVSPLPAMLSFLAGELEFLGSDLPAVFKTSSSKQIDLSSAGEQFLFYGIYRYFLKGLYDKQLYGKAALAVFSLAAVNSAAQNEKFKGDICKAFILYSKEIEHSEENLQKMEKFFQKNKLFSYKNIVSALLNT